MHGLPKGGAMLSVMAEVAECEQLIETYGKKVDIAAVNGLQSTVLSGDEGANRSTPPAARTTEY